MSSQISLVFISFILMYSLLVHFTDYCNPVLFIKITSGNENTADKLMA